MVSVIAALYIVAWILEFIACVLIALKTYFKPKKIRYVVLIFGFMTLPASLVNTLSYMDIISTKWNSFSYLCSTTFMLALHFWLNLDIGKNLRVGHVHYKSPLIVTGAAAMIGALICLICQISIMLARNDNYPLRKVFITGVCLSIFCDGTTYMYSFSALVNLRGKRLHEGQSRTTALGVWFLLIQSLWYFTFGALYIWFFCQTWEYLSTLLVFDYLLRFILCLMFTWSPPEFVIEFMSGRFFSSISQNGSNGDTGSTLAITEDKENNISYGHNMAFRDSTNLNESDNSREDVYYSSDVVIAGRS